VRSAGYADRSSLIAARTCVAPQTFGALFRVITGDIQGPWLSRAVILLAPKSRATIIVSAAEAALSLVGRTLDLDDK